MQKSIPKIRYRILWVTTVNFNQNGDRLVSTCRFQSRSRLISLDTSTPTFWTVDSKRTDPYRGFKNWDHRHNRYEKNSKKAKYEFRCSDHRWRNSWRPKIGNLFSSTTHLNRHCSAEGFLIFEVIHSNLMVLFFLTNSSKYNYFPGNVFNPESIRRTRPFNPWSS